MGFQPDVSYLTVSLPPLLTQQEASFGIKIKDVTKDSITVSVKEETSKTHTDTQTFTNTATSTATTTMPCNCPSWIPDNTYVRTE